MAVRSRSRQGKNLALSEANRLIALYTLPGYLKEYERTGQFVLPYSVDHPLTPVFEVITNPEYHYYQKLLWDLHNEKVITLNNDFKSVWRQLYSFLSYKWYFDAIYNELINRPILKIAYTTIFKSLDKGVLELFGPYGISYLLFSGAQKMKRMQLGEVYYYAYLMIMFLLIFIIILNYSIFTSLF